MKSLVALANLLIVTVSYSYSQVTFGPKTGVNFSNIHTHISAVNFPAKLTNKLGYYLGTFAQKEYPNSFILRGELVYSLKGTSYKDYRGNYQLRTDEDLRYINLPVLVGFRPIRNLSLLAENVTVLLGAELAYLFEARTFSKINDEKRTAAAGQIPSSYQTWDKALVVGLSYSITNSLELETRYNYGFTNIFSDLEEGANRVFQLGMAYHFFKSPAKTGGSKSLNKPQSPRYSF